VFVLTIAGLVLVLAFHFALLVFFVRDRRGTAGVGWVFFPFITVAVGVVMMVLGGVTRQWALLAAGYAGVVIFGGPAVLAMVRGWREAQTREGRRISD
jgi:hypothetical protein